LLADRLHERIPQEHSLPDIPGFERDHFTALHFIDALADGDLGAGRFGFRDLLSALGTGALAFRQRLETTVWTFHRASPVRNESNNLDNYGTLL